VIEDRPLDSGGWELRCAITPADLERLQARLP